LRKTRLVAVERWDRRQSRRIEDEAQQEQQSVKSDAL
jgi:hypothetical protein